MLDEYCIRMCISQEIVAIEIVRIVEKCNDIVNAFHVVPFST